MGVGYYMGTTQWSRGEFANAINKDDELAIMATYAPPVPDDHGNVIASATRIFSGKGCLPPGWGRWCGGGEGASHVLLQPRPRRRAC
jgi:hypothetical protein